MGHGEDGFGKLLPLGFFMARLPEHFRIGQDHRQGGLQLMGGVGHEPPLLLPCPLHRAHRPVGKEDAQDQKSSEACSANGNGASQKLAQGLLLQLDVGEDIPQFQGRFRPVVTQAELLQHAGFPAVIEGGIVDGHIQFGVRQVIIFVAVHHEAAPGVQRQNKAGLVSLPDKTGAEGANGALGRSLQGFDAALLQTGLGVAVLEPQHQGHHHRDDGHGDAHKFQSKAADQGSFTSRW